MDGWCQKDAKMSSELGGHLRKTQTSGTVLAIDDDSFM